MIKENRIKKNYTQEELAEIINISPRQMQRIEKNENKTKIETLKKIIKIQVFSQSLAIFCHCLFIFCHCSYFVTSCIIQLVSL